MDGKWILTLNDDIWDSNDFGTFNSKEELLNFINLTTGKELFEIWSDEHGDELEEGDEAIVLYLGQVESFVPSVNVSAVLDNISEYAHSEGGEYAEDYLHDVTKEHESDLEDLFNEVLHNWIQKYNYKPRFYTMGKLESITKEL